MSSCAKESRLSTWLNSQFGGQFYRRPNMGKQCTYSVEACSVSIILESISRYSEHGFGKWRDTFFARVYLRSREYCTKHDGVVISAEKHQYQQHQSRYNWVIRFKLSQSTISPQFSSYTVFSTVITHQRQLAFLLRFLL